MPDKTKNMIQIHSKKMPNGKWSCYATFDGYDHAFVTDSKEESQRQMRELLKKRNLEGHGLFMEEVIHPPRENASKKDTRWRRPFLDHL